MTKRILEVKAMQFSARNAFKGKVKKLVNGPVNTEVTVDLPGGGEIVSVITRSSADRLNLKEGKEVVAVIKASNVIIATD